MLKYHTKEGAIKKAQALGSQAKTFRGAVKFLRGRVKDIRSPLTRKTYFPRVERNAEAKRAYLEQKKHQMAREYLKALGLKDREELAYEKRRREQKKLSRVAEHIRENYPYRRAQGRWAGGEHQVIVKFVLPQAVDCWGEAETAWSSNRKWRGRNSVATFEISRRVLRHFPDAMFAGVVMLDARKVGKREYKCVWAEQSYGFDVKPVSGYLIKGVHVKAASIKEAREKAGRMRRKALKARLAERTAKIRPERIWVGFQDSIRAGNCAIGTKAFQKTKIQKTLGDVWGVRGDVLLSIEDNVWVRRALAKAAERYARRGRA